MEKIWWQGEIVYQIYPKSFSDSNHDGIGDLKGITSKLDYLNDLGITMLWICPIYPSPMDDNGYDISDYFGVAPEFGTLQDLEELIEEAIKSGIKIILDLVVNHTSDEHNWFKDVLANPNSKYKDYYVIKEGKTKPTNWRSVFGGSVWEKLPGRNEYYFHSFGKKQPDLNWENPELRQEIYNMVNWWLDKGISGFRIDAITFIKKDLTWTNLPADGVDGLSKVTKSGRNMPGINVFLKELQRETFTKHQCVTIAEAPGVGYDELGQFIGEDGFFNMIFDFKYADLDVKSGSEWFVRLPWTFRELNDKIMDSQEAIQRYGWGANFIENHDQPRATTKYLQKKARNTDAVKTLGAMYFFLKGTPFIYQGQELGMINFARETASDFNDLSSIDQYQRSINEGLTPEEALHIVNLRSRDNSRTPFPWSAEENGGFSTTAPWLKVTESYNEINAAAQVGVVGSIYEFYKEMIDFRQHGKYSETLVYGDIARLPLESDEMIAYKRIGQTETIYAYFNFGNETLNLSNSRAKELIFETAKGTKLENGQIQLPANTGILVKS